MARSIDLRRLPAASYKPGASASVLAPASETRELSRASLEDSSHRGADNAEMELKGSRHELDLSICK